MNKYEFALFYIKNKKYRDVGGSSSAYIFPEDSANIMYLQELVDKATPKKVLFIQFHSADFMSECYHSGTCPVCKAENDNYYGDKYCRHCGQALDWSEDEK